MRPVDRSEILSIGEYETIRPRFRARVVEEKKARRVKAGEHVSAIFENRDTVLLQIQEMLRTERITAEPAIAHEIATYNELLPGPGQLSLTVFIEIADKPTRDRILVEWAGFEDSLGVEVDGVFFPATGPKPDGFMEGRTTAVHYVKATLSPEARQALIAGTAKAALVVRHPKVELRGEMGPATIRQLGQDLADVS